MLKKLCVISLISLILTVLCLPMPTATAAAGTQTGKVEGRVVLDTKPVQGATVYAADDPEGMLRAEPQTQVALTDADGRFTLELTKGSHYIAAIKRAQKCVGPLLPGDMYCFYGGNPVNADSSRPVKLVLNLVTKPLDAGEKQSADENKGGVEGIVTLGGEPLDGVRIYVYLDANSEFKGMGYYASPPTGVNGSFRMRMNEGKYYIIARKRVSGELYGPLVEGDYFGYPDMNPFTVKKGVMTQLNLPMVKKAERFSAGGDSATAVTGIVKNTDGSPAGGVIICLYKEQKMLNRPNIVSKPTGPDGRFRVELPVGGLYYLGARDVIGGPVAPGQLWGRYNGNPEHSISPETGKTIEGIEITVEKVVGD